MRRARCCTMQALPIGHGDVDVICGRGIVNSGRNFPGTNLSPNRAIRVEVRNRCTEVRSWWCFRHCDHGGR